MNILGPTLSKSTENWAVMAWQMSKMAELPDQSQQNLMLNHHGHPVNVHWISVSTWDLGLVKIRVISNSRCKRHCKQLRMPIRRGPNADLHRVITSVRAEIT